MLKENKIVLALIAIVIAIIFSSKTVVIPARDSGNLRTSLGQIIDTDSFDWFDATLGYKINGTTVLGVTGGLSTLTITGTTTADNNLDGGFAEDFITVSATGSAQFVYTNTGGPKFCSAIDGGVYVNSVATAASPLAPSLVFSLGTSTSATGYSTNLMASTTAASTTDMVLTTNAYRFILAPGDSIVGAISDGIQNVASSTYFSNWQVNFKIPCSLLEA